MKNFKSLIAGVVVAGASLGAAGVMAADITTAPQALNLVGTSAFFGDSFNIDHMSDTFADHFTFSVSGSVPSNFDAIVSSISRTAATGLDITGLTLFTGTGTQVATGSALHSGAIDVWTLTSNNLAVGNYYVQVSGRMVSATSGSFGGAVMLAPVPEPATYGMMLAGLGLVGFMARRRGSK